ncbi:zinc finger protein 182-like [Ochlerotatus camptorhynchus]|uniref:zinc finger protein 182-like n=1 Tax=Ochlerotatus camptorhynchus TaxID=644619 RepID=UPI0031E4190D
MSKLDVDKICRLCCEKKSRMRSLFEQQKEYPRSLRQIIFDVSRLEVDSDDGMPQKICKWCVTTLLKMYETIEMYRANDLKLRNQLQGTLHIEIKQEEEEVDMGMLEKAFTQELEVGAFCVKPEAMDEEYLDSDLPKVSKSTDKMSESVSTRPALADTEHEEETVADKDDGEWKPTEQDIEDKEPPVKKYRRRTKQEKDAKGKRKMGRPRTKVDDPNRPRLHDYKCYICKSESHGTSEALIAHLNSSHEDKLPYTCPECVMETVVIKTVQKLNAHMRQHLNPEKCPYCDKRYTNKNNVALHVQMYHLDGDVQCPSTCEYCGEVYRSKVSLMHHMKLHTTAASCEICGKIFKERHKLRLHIQRRHEKLKKYECHICQKKLGSLDSVQIHIKTSHSNQVFKCSYCSKTYSSELTHRYHEKKHVENPEYVGKKDWKEYYTIVEGEVNKPGLKLKKCNLCGTISKAIGTHLSTVHFPPEFRCTICDMTFKKKQRYEIHVLEHENGKAHQCPICGREFSDRRNLIAHLRTKQHRDHPLAKSLDWLGIDAIKSRPRKPKAANCDEAEEQDLIVEDYGIDDSL